MEEDWPWTVRPGLGDLESALRRRIPALGPVHVFSCGCTSAVQALQAAHALVASGARDEALVLGVELANRTTPAGFAALNLLSRNGCRPLDRHRDGLVLGEAVAGARLGAGQGPWRLHAPALGLDPESPTGFREDGSTVARVMARALERAGLAPGDVAAVKVQAAGAPGTDAVEVRALARVFGEALPPCLSLKAALGHTLGASGLAEMAALAACAEAGWLPPTAGFTEADPLLGLEPLRATRPFTRGALLLNIQGFGGGLASWVLEAP
jgi:3-oxoacyl-[acyl-carrier-protein] synthase-1